MVDEMVVIILTHVAMQHEIIIATRENLHAEKYKI